MDFESLTSKLLAPKKDSESSDPLMNRFEDKYLVQRKHLEKLTAGLREHLKEGEVDTQARFNVNRTIYLDTPDLDCFRDAVGGVRPRFKVRLRHYAPNGILESVAYLELKIKTHDGFTKKTRIRIPAEAIPVIASGQPLPVISDRLMLLNRDVTPAVLMDRLDTINSTLTRYGFRRQITVQYMRRAYSNPAVRVTVDENITYQDAQNMDESAEKLIKDAPGWKRMARVADEVKDSPYVILEVKHRGSVAPWLSKLMDDVEAKSVNFSKYCAAVYSFVEDGKPVSGDVSRNPIDVAPLMSLFGEAVAKSKSKEKVELALVILRDKNFILVGKRRKADKWGLPGGKFEPGEDKEEVALRELKEETGIKLKRKDLKYEGKKTVETRDQVKSVYVFSAQHPGGEPTVKNDPDKEFESWEWARCEDGMLPAKILEDRMNKPTSAAFEKMGLSKGDTVGDIESLIDKLSKGGPGSGVRGHVTLDRQRYAYGAAKYAQSGGISSEGTGNRTSKRREARAYSGKLGEVTIPESDRSESRKEDEERDKELAQQRKVKKAAPFEESKHPRAHGGKFATSGGDVEGKGPDTHHAGSGDKLKDHLKTLKEGAVIPGFTTQSGKPIVTSIDAAKAHKYSIQDHMDAMNVHHKLAEKTQKTIDKLQAAGHKVPEEGKQIAKFHEDQMKAHMKSRQYLQSRQEGTETAIKDKKEKTVEEARDRGVLKSTTQMGSGIGDRDLDIAAYAMARDKAQKHWMEKMYASMHDCKFGDMPKSFELERGDIHLAKVDDGLYSGYYTAKDNGMLDNAKMRIERITIPELVQLMSAKEWISPLQESYDERQFVAPAPSSLVPPPNGQPVQKFNEGSIPAAFSNNAPPEMQHAPQPAPMVEPSTQGQNAPEFKKQIAGLIEKLLS